MKQQIKTFLAGGLLALALFGTAMAGPLEDAKATYQKGYEAWISRLNLPLAENAEAQADYATALQMFRRLAEQGDAEAQSYLGKMYAKGEGVPQDDAQAFIWCRKAADQGNADGQIQLGGMYQTGIVVPKDTAQAMAWYRKAADGGNAFAQLIMGSMYQQANGDPPQDLAQAVAWYRKAADQGEPLAQLKVGDMYRDGHGVPQDRALAHMWYNLAASRGMDHRFREDIAAKMTPAQIAEAERMAREWVPKK